MTEILVTYNVDSMRGDVDVTLRFSDFIEYTRFMSMIETGNKNIARYLEVMDTIRTLERHDIKGDVLKDLMKRRDRLNEMITNARKSLDKYVNEHVEEIFDLIGDGDGIDSFPSYESNRISASYMGLETEQGLKVTWFTDGSSRKSDRRKPVVVFDEEKRKEYMGEEYAVFVEGKKEMLKGLREIFKIANKLEDHVRTIGK